MLPLVREADSRHSVRSGCLLRNGPLNGVISPRAVPPSVHDCVLVGARRRLCPFPGRSGLDSIGRRPTIDPPRTERPAKVCHGDLFKSPDFKAARCPPARDKSRRTDRVFFSLSVYANCARLPANHCVAPTKNVFKSSKNLVLLTAAKRALTGLLYSFASESL